MSFINKKSNKDKNNNININYNHEGEVVFLLDPMKTLLTKTLSSFFGQSTYYEKRNPIDEYKSLIQLIEQIPEEDKEYVLKIAEIGRRTGMKEYPLNILAVCYHMERYKGQNFLSKEGKNKIATYADNIVRRTKDINHLIAIDKELYGEKIPSQMKKNLKKKIESYDEYKLSKGLDRNKVVSLADSIKILRPTPKTSEMANFYKKIIENNVIVGNDKKQIQSEIEKIINNKKEEKEISKGDLIDAIYKANLSALIKNINNYIKFDLLEDKKVYYYICRKLADKNSIIKSKMLPYEFYAAYKSISLKHSSKYRKILDSLSNAIDISIENSQNIEGYTAFLIDLSASMLYSNISNKSTISALEMACLLGAISYKKGCGDLFVFSNEVKRVYINSNDSIIGIMKQIENTITISGTKLDNALNYISKFAKEKKISYDNLLLISDGDCYSYDNKIFKIGDHSVLDNIVDEMIFEKTINSFWLNDLTGNNFTVVNTDNAKKNLIMGYNDTFIDIINLYQNIRVSDDVRLLIDSLLDKYRKEK